MEDWRPQNENIGEKNTRQRWVLFSVCLFFVSMVALPFVYSQLAHFPAGESLGIGLVSSADLPVYFSYIRQGAQGAFAFVDLFTAEEPQRGVVYAVWLVIGWGARLFSVTPPVAFHVAKIFVAALALPAVWWAVGVFASGRFRRLSFLFFLFGSGIGALAVRLGWYPASWIASSGGTLFSPFDMWVPELTFFGSAVVSPHFVVSWVLYMASMVLLYRVQESLRWHATFGAATLHTLFLFLHPYYILPLFIVAIGIVVLRIATKQPAWPLVVRLGIVWMIASPAVAYHLYFGYVDPLLAIRATQNVAVVAHAVPMLIGLGIFFPLMVLYFVFRHIKSTWTPQDRFLIVWIVALIVAVILPTQFQRRYVEGLYFPMAIGAAGAVQMIFYNLRGKMLRIFFVCAIVSLSFYSSADFLYRYTTTQEIDALLVPAGQADGYVWMRARLPEGSVVLSWYHPALLIPGITGHVSYLAHKSETLHWQEKYDDMQLLFSQDPITIASALRDRGITHVAQDTRYPWFAGVSLRDISGIDQVFGSDTFVVYAVVSEN